MKNNKTVKITYKTNISRLLKRMIRDSVGVKGNIPVCIVDNDSPPKLCGSPYRYENVSGDIIHYPNAYKRAWGKPIYIHSTRRVEVGAKWLLNNMTMETLRLNKIKAFL